MRLLARYLLRECLVALGFCFSAFLVFWIASDLVTNLSSMQESKMRGTDIAAYYFFMLPDFLPIAIPVALLLALLYALTNHARYNEITAIRAAGVSLWRISLPYFGIAIFCAASLFLLNEYIAPISAERAEEVKNSRLPARSGVNPRIKKNLVFTNSREGRAWHIGAYDKENGNMSHVALEWQLRDGTVRSIFAQYGTYSNRVWTFRNVREMRRASGMGSVHVKSETNLMVLPDLSETPEIIRSEISIAERFSNQGRTRSADIPLRVIRNYIRLHPNPERSMQRWLSSKWHGRFAGPATCLVVVLLAIPFSAGSGRRNVFVGVAASLGIFFAYHILQQIGFAFGEAGHVPTWFGAWFPNLLAAGAGLLMLARVR
ncbi:MAG TPA: LptF/LptG family permease [Verrucomicrobiae bacterium]|nr:LptF/LptG family permease [Verrucomicrobiae bacterium]